ncbi:MAG TPA: RNA methyltransferase [Holophagaceae bacterium]|nr:RNA methyltransferase [Holophagaceae bacterium]
MPISDPDWDPYRSLRAAESRAHPEHGPCFIVEGRILVEDLLAEGRAGRLRVVSVASAPKDAERIVELLPEDAKLLVAEERDIAELAGFAFHRGLMACAVVPPEATTDQFLAARRLLVLPRIHDAENLGLLIRSAAALGVEGVLAGPGPDPWSRRTTRVSMGAVWRLPVWRREDPWALLEHWRLVPGSEVVAAALVPGAEDARAWTPGPRCALVLGPEGPGLGLEELDRCDRAIQIPMAHAVDSLNVAAAGAILMFRMLEGG